MCVFYLGGFSSLGGTFFGFAKAKRRGRPGQRLGEHRLGRNQGRYGAPARLHLPDLAHRGIWAELVNTARKELTLLTENCVRLLPYSLVLLRYGRDRRLAVDPRGERGA